MAAVNAGALEYKFSADIADIKAKLGEIRQQMQQVGTQAKQAGDDITSGMRAARGQVEEMGIATRITANLLAGLARGFVAGLLVQGISASISAVAELGQTAKLTYTSLQDLQRIQIAAQGQGIGSKEFNDGAQKFAKLLNDATRDTNTLSELFKANGVSLTDQTGKAKSFKDMLLAAADMVKNARTELDKIEIAERVGLTKEWVDFLEQGKDEITAQADEAERTGTILDDATIKKAEEFRRAWEGAVARWQDFFQKAILAITELIDKLWEKVKGVGDLLQAVSLNAKLTTGAPLDKDDVAYAQKRIKEGSAVMTDRLRDAIEAQRLSDSLEPNAEGMVATVNNRNGKRTNSGPKSTGTIIPGKGGDSGAAERQDAIERYLSQLQRSVELAKVEYETFGKSTAERLKAVNLVRAEEVARREGRDLTEDERKKIGQMSEEQARFNDLLERARDIQQAVKSLGDTFANAIDDWIVRGTKFKDVLANLARSLASMALKGALTGDGPIGSLLGLGGKNGAMGGIFGAIFNGLFGGFKATGGPVSPSKGYMVGENGPEWFQPNSAGSIIPNGAQSTAATGPKITIQQTFTADASPRELAQIAGQIEAKTFNAVKMAIARGSM